MDFYGILLGCKQGRSSSDWIDYNFFGHQLVVHLDKNIKIKSFNSVDGKNVPVRHFGLILDWENWHIIKNNLIKQKVSFIIEPYIRFSGQKGEQATLFIADPSFNGIELKSFKEKEMIFAT